MTRMTSSTTTPSTTTTNTAPKDVSIDARIYDWTVRLWGESLVLDALFTVVAKWTPVVMLSVIVLASTGFAWTSGTLFSPHASAAIAIASAILARIVNEPISRIAARPRPFQQSLARPLVQHDEGDSFPSNHATGAFALALGFFSVPGYFYILISLAFLLAVARVYAGLHYFTDVVAGAVNGTVITLFVAYVLHVVY